MYYGFNQIYDKLSCLEKIYSLDLAFKSKHPKFEQMMNLIYINFLRVDYDDFYANKLDINGKPLDITVHNLI